MKEFLLNNGFSFVKFEDNDKDNCSGTYKLFREDISIIIYNFSKRNHWQVHMFREDETASVDAEFLNDMTPEQFINLISALNIKL